jgi:predicted transposase YdaD
MQDYDSTLRFLLQSAATAAQRVLAGAEVVEWLNIEFPRIQQLRADLVGRTDAGSLLHIEIQSQNDSSMPLRMLEYGLAILRTSGQFPRQIVVYVGADRLTMPSRLRLEGLDFSYRLIEIRDVDSEPLLASSAVSDNVIGILGRVTDVEAAVRAIVARISGLPAGSRAAYLRALLVLAGLRGWEQRVEREVSRMPLTINILENKVIGPAYKRGLDEGQAKGLAEGKAEGERSLLCMQIEKRFGPLPGPARERIEQASPEQVEQWALRLLDVTSLDELLR